VKKRLSSLTDQWNSKTES